MSAPARYLFERLSDPRSGLVERSDPLIAIRENVQRIVASARGPFDGQAGLFGFGLTSPVVLGRDSTAQRTAYMQELAALIARWEGRLKNVVVEAQSASGSEGPFRLVVCAQLALGEMDEVRFPLEIE